MSNPLVVQGQLNRLKASVVFATNSALNVTASYLNKDGIRLALEGETTVYLPTMTGAVTSQEPYMMATVTINLLKTQPLASAFKNQMETNSQLGDLTVWPDATQLPPYPIVNTSITGIEDLPFNGDSAGFVIRLRGYYLVNSNLFN